MGNDLSGWWCCFFEDLHVLNFISDSYLTSSSPMTGSSPGPG